MRVFSVPISAPFLRTVIAALVDGRLIDGFKPGARPADLVPELMLRKAKPELHGMR